MNYSNCCSNKKTIPGPGFVRSNEHTRTNYIGKLLQSMEKQNSKPVNSGEEKSIYQFEQVGNELFIGGKKVIKGFESFTGWYWFITEDTDQEVYFGLVQGFETEWGYISKQEINDLVKKGSVWEIPKRNLVFSGRSSN